MFCENCGSKIDSGAVFCENCGAKVNAPEETAPQNETRPSVCANCGAPITGDGMFCEQCGARVSKASAEPSPSADAFSAVKAKKGGKKGFLKIGAPIIAAVAAVSVLVGAVPATRNSFMKLVLSDKAYCKYAINKSIDDIADKATGAFKLIQDISAIKDKGYKSCEAETKIELGDKGKEIIGDLIYEASGEYIDSEYYSWIDDVSVKASAAVDYEPQVEASLAVNDTDIISYSMKFEDNAMYFAVPEISDETLRIDFSSYGVSAVEMGAMMGMFEKLEAVVPSKEVSAEILKRYIAVAVENIDDIEEESDKVEVDGVKQTLTKTSVTIDAKTILDVSEAVLKEVKDDDDIKKIMKDFVGFLNETGEIDADFSEVYDQFRDGIDDLLGDLKDADPDDMGDEELVINFWFDSKGDIAGIGFEFEEAEAYFIAVEKGSKSAIILEIADQVRFEGKGETKRKLLNGEYTLTAKGSDVAVVSVEDWNTKKWEDGIANGKIKIELGKDAKNMISLGMSGSGELVDLVSSLNILIEYKNESLEDMNEKISLRSDSDMLISVSASAKLKKSKADIDMPSAICDEDEFAENLQNNLDAIIDALRDAGMPWSLADVIEESLEEETSYYTDDYYYYY